jgi:hypothetical protein
MVNTYTTKLGLAKPANGDVDWHIPINENWDDIDSKLGPLYEDITSGATELTLSKKLNANEISVDNYTSLKVKLFPFDSIVKTERAKYDGSMSSKGTMTLGTFTVPSEYIEGSIIGIEGWVQIIQAESYTASAYINVIVNGVTVKTFQAYANGFRLTIKVEFEDYISIKGDDVITVTLVGSPAGSEYNIAGASGEITFYGEDVIPFTSPNPTWS